MKVILNPHAHNIRSCYIPGFRSRHVEFILFVVIHKNAWPAEMGITFLGPLRATDGCASRPINLTVQCVIPYSAEIYTGDIPSEQVRAAYSKAKRCRAGPRERLCFFSSV